jgi:hypothetical protein
VFRVASIEATRTIVERAGYLIADENGVQSLNLKDPSGNIVELVPDGYLAQKRH